MMESHAHPESSGKDGDSDGFHPSGRQVIGAIVVILLVVFIASNTTEVTVDFVVKEVQLQMWIVLAGTALLSVGIGMLLGARRTKRKYVHD